MDDHSELRTAPGTGQGQHRKLHPPFAQPDPGRRAMPHMATMASEISEEVDDQASLPPIEQFVDELPLIDEFLVSAHAPTPMQVDSMQHAAPGTSVNALGTNTEEGWADADWQSYDWSRLASLGAPAPEAAEAHAAWSSTNWEARGTGSRDASGSAMYLQEDEVAAALDEIARRIRSGELSLHQFRGSPPEAAIAAAFASLLRNRG